MPSELYRFHCTDGDHAVLDLTGRSVPSGRGVRACAERVAREVMAGCPGADWSGWIVDVHDEVGRRALTLAFAEVPAKPAALAV